MIRIPLVFACVLGAAVPATAQQPRATGAVASSAAAPELALTPSAAAPAAPAPLAPFAPAALAPIAPPAPLAPVAPTPRRPRALVPLYGSFAALQALDYASTRRALAGGAGREANPVMGPIVGNRAAFMAVKAAATAGVILAGEKMWKKNRVATVIFVAALNGAMTAIVARNYSLR